MSKQKKVLSFVVTVKVTPTDPEESYSDFFCAVSKYFFYRERNPYMINGCEISFSVQTIKPSVEVNQ